MKKSDITIHSDGHRSYPAVNVKIYWYSRHELPNTLKQVRAAEDCDPMFTVEWIDALSDEQRNRCWEWAIENAWDQLTADVNAENVFGRTVMIYSIGRSGGWAIVDDLKAEDVPSWNAIKVAQWSRFARFARQTADDVPYQYIWNLYEHEFKPWQAQQNAIAAFCQEM